MNLIEEIKEFREKESALVKKCKEFCADESKPIALRWDFFKIAPGKKYKAYTRVPKGLRINFFDDFGIERHETIDVINWIEERAAELEIFTERQFDILKNYYMVNYIGSFVYDW